MLIVVGDTCAFGNVVLGQTDTYGAEWYFTGIDGWEASQSTLQVTQRPAGDGGFASPIYASAPTFTVYGVVVAPSRPELEGAWDRLQAAATVNLQPVLVTRGGAARYRLAGRQGVVQITDETDIYRAFTLIFQGEDPRKFATQLSAATRLPSAIGGWTLPFTVPFAINSVVNAGTVTLTNPGNAVGPVQLRIDGPVKGATITHVGSGATLVFGESNTIIAGNYVAVDMERRTVLENGQANRNQWVTSRGFSGFDPGVNQWAFAAVEYNPSAHLTVFASPAWV